MSTRFNLFTIIHKGLRHALQHLVWTAGRLDVADRGEREKFYAEFNRIALMLHQHANDEDTYFQPLIESCAPEVAEELETQHKRSDALLIRLEQTIQTLERAETFPSGTWLTFVDELNRFVGDYFLHLYHEECVAMPRLWEAYEDAFLMEASAKLRQNIPPHIQSDFQRYMIPAITIQEQTLMLTLVKQSVPAPVFEELCKLFESLLSPEEWAALRSRVVAMQN